MQLNKRRACLVIGVIKSLDKETLLKYKCMKILQKEGNPLPFLMMEISSDLGSERSYKSGYEIKEKQIRFVSDSFFTVLVNPYFATTGRQNSIFMIGLSLILLY